MTIIIAAWLIGCAFLAWHLWGAPEGWQDENGFHFGPGMDEDERDWHDL